MSATLRIMSFGVVQFESFPRQLDADHARRLELPREIGHHVDRVGAADADRARAEAAAVGRVRVGADHQEAGEGVVLEDDLGGWRVGNEG